MKSKINRKLIAFLLCLVMLSSFGAVAIAESGNDSLETSQHDSARNVTQINHDVFADLNALDMTELPEGVDQFDNELDAQDISVLDNIASLVDVQIADISAIESIESIVGDVSDGIQAATSDIAPMNSNPNDAIFIPDSWMNFWISNTSTTNESWYAFAANGGTKITVALQQPPSGIYLTQLYRLEGNTLFLVEHAQSMYGSSAMLQQFSHVPGTSGIYFFRIIPFVPVNSTYHFIIATSTTFDSAEPDDNALSPRVRSMPFTVNQTIDNPLDIDWIRFSTGNFNRVTVALSNVPAGHTYALRLYDANLNLIASFATAGSATRVWQLPRNTTFYLDVRSHDGGSSATQSYQLSVQGRNIIESGVTPNGNLIEVAAGDALYVNGNRVSVHWNNFSQTHPINNSWISRDQRTSGGEFRLASSLNSAYFGEGSYTGAIFRNPSVGYISYSNVIIMNATNFIYRYQFTRFVNSQRHPDSFGFGVRIQPNQPPNLPIGDLWLSSSHLVINANTGVVVDVLELNQLYIIYGHTPTLNGQNLFR